jgi:hypothetical protein
MVYVLLDTDTGNVIQTFGSEEEALAEVRAYVHEIGREWVRFWALLRVDSAGERRGIADGDALIGRALGTDQVGRTMSA